MRNKREIENTLDNVTNKIRDEKLDPETIDAAANRVWSKIVAERRVKVMEENKHQVEQINGCADFQALMPDFVRGELTSARALLLEDHTHECLPCRKSLKEAKTGRVAEAIRPAASLQEAKKGLAPVWKWAIAAAAVVIVGVLSFPFVSKYFGPTASATMVASNGIVYRVNGETVKPLAQGEEIKEGDRIRVAKDANAVLKLNDGSMIEMRERSEVHLSHEFSGRIINLERGQVIVEAAKQTGGNHLYVQTADSKTSVVGTIFSVNNGTKGTRVSVVEGEVHVTPGNGEKKVLKPGDQTSTQPALENNSVKAEVAWSQNSKKYNELIDQLAALQKEVNKVPLPDVRYSSTLLDKVPDNTVFYAALPNLTQSLVESNRVMQERINQNPTLKAWWEKEQQKGGPRTEQIIERVRQFGDRLGNEIVISAEMDSEGRPTSPLILANAKSGADFRPFLEGQLQTLNLNKDFPAVKIIDDPMTLAAVASDQNKNQLLIWINGDVVAAAPEVAQLQSYAKRVRSSGPSAFTASGFYGAIANVYKEGAGILVAADLEKIMTTSLQKNAKDSGKEDKQNEANRQLGLFDFKYFIFEQKQKAKVQTRATLTFAQTDHGIPSWLAQSGPMGTLNYISPDANAVTAFAVKDPVKLVDDLLNHMKVTNSYMSSQLADAEKDNGISLRNDIAASLGGEFAFAIDGPIIPTPSWKLIVEVYDTNRLQQTLERAVQKMNEKAAANGKKGFIWTNGTLGGRTFYTVKSVEYGLEFNYVFDNGYMIAGASRALIDRALRGRDAGQTLVTSARFREAMPEDGNANFSAIIYQNLAPLAKPLAEKAQGMGNKLPVEGGQALSALADSAPTLLYAYAQGDRITFATNTEGGPFGIGPATLLGMPTGFQMENVINDSMREK